MVMLGRMSAVRNASLIVGIVGLILFGIGLLTQSTQALQSYLFGYVFWITVSFGSLAVLMIQYTVRNNWGIPLRRLLEAGMVFTLPLMAILFLPIAFSLPAIYPWARPDVIASDPLIQSKSAYLNTPFFLVRTAIYFVIWLILAYFLAEWSRRQDESNDPRIMQRLQSLSLVGAVLIAVTCSFALIDWMMSLEPHWFSSIYPGTIAGGGLIAAFSLAIVGMALLHQQETLAAYISTSVLINLGSLLLAGLMFWVYLAFSQYIVIYSGNLSDEISWYSTRLNGGWEWVAFVLAVAGFFGPFFALFSPRMKSNIRPLAIIAAFVFVMHVLDIFWLIVPAFHPEGFHVSWLDIVALIAIGGLWIAAATWYLEHHRLVPLYPETGVTGAEAEAVAHG